jgi:single-strand DNA-binding protein
MATRVRKAREPATKQVAVTKADAALKADSTKLPATTAEHRNEVIVSGRLSAAALPKQLPSGDQIVTWRLVVDRVVTNGTRKVDLVDCTTFGARVRRQALAWNEGDLIEVVGALRRRFWRGAGGLQSRCEVEVASASRRPGAAGARKVVAAALTRPRTPG